jgi:hypothetical protein
VGAYVIRMHVQLKFLKELFVWRRVEGEGDMAVRAAGNSRKEYVYVMG